MPLLPYDSRSVDLAASEIAKLNGITACEFIAIHHVGSTAARLPGSGKIDLLAFVAPGRRVILHEWMESDVGPYRQQFSRQAAADFYWLHVMPLEMAAFGLNMIRFRNRLWTRPALRESYVALKIKLAADGLDGSALTAAKTAFISDALALP